MQHKRAGLRAVVPVAVVALAAAVAGGCAEQPTRLDLHSVARPEGGHLATLAVVEDEHQTHVIIPSGRRVYVREARERSWRGEQVAWPSTIERPGGGLFSGLRHRESSYNFPNHQTFVGRDTELWTIATPSFGEAPRLLVSRDLASSWSEVALPASLTARDDEAAPRAPRGEAGDGGVGPGGGGASGDADGGLGGAAGLDDGHRAPEVLRLRLLKARSGELFLTDSRRIWRLDAAPGEAVEARSWTRVGLEGIEPQRAARREPLPTIVRSYVPATDARPYELLTVLREQLHIYKRVAGAEQWVLAATLPTIDRQLIEIAGGDMLYLVAPDAIYRASDHGERWERIHSSGHLPQPPTFSAMQAVADATSPVGHVLVLGSHDGGIWRSTDGGQTWDVVHARDPDLRGITDFACSERQQMLWATTGGNGVLVSTDGGLNWRQDNQDLAATRVFDLASGPSGELLLGTDAGLFRLTGDPRSGHWHRLHGRATSTIFVHPENQRIFSGTLGGSIVVQHPDGQEHTSDAAPLGEVDALLFQPAHLQSARLPASAIVDIRGRPGSQQMFAWSHQQGPLTSSDAGASWRRMRLNSALSNALSGQVITNFATETDQRLYLVTRSLDHQQPSQLWRSHNNGESWHAIYYFMESASDSPLRIEHDSLQQPDSLLMVHGNRYAHSVDQGTSWTSVVGPWQKGTITAFGGSPEQTILIANLAHSSEIFFVGDPELANPIQAQFTLIWPADEHFRREHVLDVVAHDRYLYISDVDHVFVGTLPRRRTRLPEGIAIILTIGGLALLTGASFAFLRQP